MEVKKKLGKKEIQNETRAKYKLHAIVVKKINIVQAFLNKSGQ